ncbi:MAG TPA: hypothetical protein VII93_05525 [Anaerolineales bacterium]
MFTDEKRGVREIVERYARTGSTTNNQVKVTLLPNDKTSFVERNGEDGRTILLDEYNVDGKIIWAGYSTRSGTVYLSNVTRR